MLGRIPYKTKVINSFYQGLNTQDDPEELGDADLTDCENIEVNEGTVRSAGGYVQYGTIAQGKYWGIYQFKSSTGTQRLIRQRGALLEYDNSGTWTTCTLPTTGSPAQTVTLTQTYCTFATLNDIVLWSNGTDTIMSSTDGITWTLQASLPKSKVIIHDQKNHIMFLNQPANPGRVDWSNINDPLTIDPASYQWIGKNDNQTLLGAGIDEQGNITFFKEQNVYSISDITSGMVAVEPMGVLPFTNHRTVTATENSLIVAGVDGIYEIMGGVIRNIANRINWREGRNNIDQFDSWYAVYHNGIYRLAIPDANVTSNYNGQEWLLYKKMSRSIGTSADSIQPHPITRNKRYIGCYGTEEYESGNTVRRRLYFGDSRSGATGGSPASVVDSFAYINDIHDPTLTQGLNGAYQDCYFTTKFFTEGMPYIIKRYKKFFSRIKNDTTITVTISYRYDPQQTWVDTNVIVPANSFGFIFGNGSTGTFSQGYGFSSPLLNTIEKDLERGTDERGVQFKISFSTTNDVYFTSFSYNFLSKIKLN